MNSSSTSDSWIGRLIGDRQRYRLEQVIGKGGMGDVYLAVDTRLAGQQVALKLLKDTLIGAGELRKRFEREAALCAALRSDHIVQVTDYGVTAESHPFYVMEYLRGQTLGQLLRKLSRDRQRLSVERTVSIIRQVCDGLQLAHKGVTMWRDGATVSEHIQVVHRDLKPDNIFLVPTALGELVKILDFGIAKIRDEAAEQTHLTSTFMGTFRYAPPEQLQVDQNLDGRADIYSLGIILYEMLSGSDPFGFGVKASSTSGVMWGMAHASKPPQPLRIQLGCEQLPTQLEATVMRCLQKSPDDRFQSVDELSQALQSCISQRRNTASEQETDTTLAQKITPTPVSGNDKTIPRTLSASEQNTTIDRDRIHPQSYPDPTIDPISPSPAQQSYLEEVNVIPTVQRQREVDSTIDPIVSSPSQHYPDPTIGQPLHPQSYPSPDTHPVPSPSRQENYNEINNQEGKAVPGLSFRLPTHVLLALGAGIAVSLAVIGGIYAYFQSQPSREPVPEKPQPSCDDPNSIFCPK